MSRLVRHLPLLWAVLLALLMLGPAMGPGYVLSYDMVWVPHLALRPDFLGTGSALPRAVPSDAVVAVLDNLVPAMLLQKVALAAPLVAAGVGMARLVGRSLVARLVAVTLAVWNPFVVERLLIGHWTVLIGYGVLPWLLLFVRRWRREAVMPRELLLLLPLGSLSANSGLVSTIVMLVGLLPAGSGPARRRSYAGLMLCAAANAPWFVAGLFHSEAATTAATGAFALHGEGSLPAPLAALTLGGIWNNEVVPVSRTTFVAWLSAGLLIVLVASGVVEWWRRSSSESARWLVLWALGLVVALAGWLLPDLVSWLAREVPGGGVLRDGHRWLALCLPAYASVPAVGAEVLCHRLAAQDRLARSVVGGACVLLPALLLFDAGWGASGRLQPVEYPPGWSHARAVVGERGRVLVLPFSAYRAPAWNHGRTVLDPLGRYLAADFLVDDRLRVGDRLLPGEDPDARSAARALARSDAQSRASALRRLGVRWVVTEHDATGPAPDVAGERRYVDESLQVVRLQGSVRAREPGLGQAVALAVGWLAYLVILAGGLAGLLVRVLHRGRMSARRRVSSGAEDEGGFA